MFFSQLFQHVHLFFIFAFVNCPLEKLTFLKDMKALIKILVVLPFSLLIGGGVLAQGIPGIQDTAVIRQQRTEAENKAKTKAETEKKAKAEIDDESKGKSQAEAKTMAAEKANIQAQTHANENSAIKRVASARPDMSKAKGARPGSIVRPAGSRLPKGVGKPGGAAGGGRR